MSKPEHEFATGGIVRNPDEERPWYELNHKGDLYIPHAGADGGRDS